MRQSPIQQPDLTVLTQHEVVRFQIPMHHAALMSMCKGIRGGD